MLFRSRDNADIGETIDQKGGRDDTGADEEDVREIHADAERPSGT